MRPSRSGRLQRPAVPISAPRVRLRWDDWVWLGLGALLSMAIGGAVGWFSLTVWQAVAP